MTSFLLARKSLGRKSHAPRLFKIMTLEERKLWMLRHEHLWSDKDALLEQVFADGVYSRKLSNVRHFVDGLIADCKLIKKQSKYAALPLKPRTNLVMTADNFDELIKMREVIDILSAEKHPFRKMDYSGFTFYDYAVFLRKEKGKCHPRVVEWSNIIFIGGSVPYYV